ncbi:MAG: BamA/TamA family outer membrane protein [Planctomycetes bacterium]|nr:BamA/TamA family outer membrane protein [Planctomycetota bacterium]
MLAAALSALLLPAQVSAPPPAARAQERDDSWDPAVAALAGREVAAILIRQADARGRLVPVAEDVAAAVLRGLATRTGQPLELRKVTADCQAAWNERRLAITVAAQPTGDKVTLLLVIDREVQVYERVEFAGLHHFTRTEIDDLLGLYTDRQVTSKEAEAMRNVLTARYRRDGFAFCSVDLGVRDPEIGLGAVGDRPRQVLTFKIDEGPKVAVRTIRFRGNSAFPSRPALGIFGAGDYLLRESHIASDPRWGLIRGEPYSREVLAEDVDKLRLFYRSRGFLDATVDLVGVEFTPGHDEVDLEFLVVEGPRYRIRSIQVVHVDESNQPVAEGRARYRADEVAAVLRSRPGEFYDHARLRRDQTAIQDWYGERGHPSRRFPGMDRVPGACLVSWPPRETYTQDAQVDVTFEVFEGQPKTLRDVVIRGNTFTRDKVIRRKIYAMPGERIDMSKVDRSIRYLNQTRFFQDPVTMVGPRFEILPAGASEDEVDLAIDVTEGETGEFRWGIGISTGAGAQASLNFNKRNFDLFNLPSSPNPFTALGEVIDNKAFHGGGQQLDMLLAPGTEVSQFQLTFTEPDVFGEHFDTHELRVSGQRRIRRFRDGYTTDTLGADIGLARWFTEEISAGIGFRHNTIEVDGLSADAPSTAWDALGQTELRGLRLSARYRDLDDLRRPTAGAEFVATAELVGGFLGGEESLWKATLSGNAYVPLWENDAGHRHVLRLEPFFGVATGFGGSDDVFLTERFYMGGSNLRGFNLRGAGPSQFGRPYGGEAILTFTAEYGFPLVATRLEHELRDRELLRGVVFTDVGLLGLDLADPTFRELRGASGFGIRIEVPYFEIPIALDLAWPWQYEETDDRRQFYFSISR